MPGSEMTARTGVSRRKVIAGGLGALAAGGTYLTVGARGVRAAVDVGGLTVSDGTTEVPDGEVYSPVVELTADWAFEGCDAATDVFVGVLIDTSLVASQMMPVSGGSDSGQTDLSAVVVDSREWDSTDWHAPDGGKVTHEVDVELRMEVRDVNHDTLAKAKAADTTTVTVRDGGVVSDADVGGSGSVAFAENESAAE